MMAATFVDMRRIWGVTRRRDPATVKFMTGLSLLLTVAIPIVGGLFLWRQHTLPVVLLLRILLGIGAFWLAVVWVWLFVPGAVLMNSAANARLLPRQRRRLVQMAIAGWLLVTLAAAVAIGEWGAFPMVGLYVLGFALMRAGHLQAVALTVLPGFWPALAKYVLPAPFVAAITHGTGLLMLSALLLVAVAWSLARLFPAAGDRHLRRRSEQVVRLSRLDAGGWGTVGETDSVMTAPGLRAYRAILRRDCRAPRADAMLMHALGPNAHWSAWIAAILLVAGLNLFAYLVVLVRGADAVHSFIEGFSWGGLSGLALMIAFSTASIRQQMDRKRGEQALLLLTPLAGDRALLNRRLGTRMLQNALLQWAAITAGVLATGALFGDAGLMLRQLALCCLGGQVALACLFGDFSRTPKLGIVRAVLLGALALFELGVAAGLGWLCGALLPWMWPWLIAISVIAGALQVRHGWRVLMAAPVAFPAGRLA
ncbi:hypothetical protein [uncultured Massilia sp.]|uniref:hypothetical protein n=1 Tax=uncultured Massilia sp. TaxID=169973 RepID=UPI0025E0A1CD|nr:hypothetical protein [uncultured Massilia sp.]